MSRLESKAEREALVDVIDDLLAREWRRLGSMSDDKLHSLAPRAVADTTEGLLNLYRLRQVLKAMEGAERARTIMAEMAAAMGVSDEKPPKH